MMKTAIPLRWRTISAILLMSVILVGVMLNLFAVKVTASSAGYALDFDGNNDFVELASTALIMGPNWVHTKTIEFWVKPEGPGEVCGYNSVGFCDNVFGDRPRWWGVARGVLNGQDRIWVWNTDENVDVIPVTYTPDEWMHLAVVHSGSVITIYKNGLFAVSQPSGSSRQPNTGALPVLHLGGVINSTTRVWTLAGQMDEVRIWNIARSQAEIQADMQRSLTGNENGLSAYYKMSDGAGTILTDDSIYNWNGTLFDGARGVPPDGQPPLWVTSTAFGDSLPTATPEPPTATPEPPTATPEPPTATPEPPTATPEPPTATPEPPTATPEEPTATPEPPTATPEPPTATPEQSTATSEPPTATPEGPTATPEPPTATPEPPTATPELPTATPEPATATPEPPTATPEPPTATPLPPTPTPNPLIFADGFESGNLSAWSSSVTSGGDLSVSTAAALLGNFGMHVLIDDNTARYVVNQSPTAETHYRASFRFDPNSIVMASMNHHVIFQAYQGSNQINFRVTIMFQNGQYRVQAEALDNGNIWRTIPWVVISDTPHLLEVDWYAATNGANGSLSFSVDGVTDTFSGIANAGRLVDFVRLGPLSGIDTGTRGVYYFDDFNSSR